MLSLTPPRVGKSATEMLPLFLHLLGQTLSIEQDLTVVQVIQSSYVKALHSVPQTERDLE